MIGRDILAILADLAEITAEEYDSLLERLRRLKEDTARYSAQIEEAKKRGMSGFD